MSFFFFRFSVNNFFLNFYPRIPSGRGLSRQPQNLGVNSSVVLDVSTILEWVSFGVVV